MQNASHSVPRDAVVHYYMVDVLLGGLLEVGRPFLPRWGVLDDSSLPSSLAFRRAAPEMIADKRVRRRLPDGDDDDDDDDACGFWSSVSSCGSTSTLGITEEEEVVE